MIRCRIPSVRGVNLNFFIFNKILMTGHLLKMGEYKCTIRNTKMLNFNSLSEKIREYPEIMKYYFLVFYQ